MIDLVEDVSNLTCVPDHILKKFVPIINYSIAHGVYETKISDKSTTVVNLSIGELHIQHENNSVKYRFIPSVDLEKLVAQTITTNRSPIVSTIEKNLEHKIKHAYKELL